MKIRKIPGIKGKMLERNNEAGFQNCKNKGEKAIKALIVKLE